MNLIRVTFATMLIGTLSVGGHRALAAKAAERPNVVVILADDLGYGDVGFHGCQDFATPHLDALARSGVVCRNGYVSHSFCAPSRAGMLTGRYQHRFGFEGNPRFGSNEGLPADQILLPQVLAQSGYTSGIVGKWHLGSQPRQHPLEHGFDFFYGFVGGGHNYLKADLTPGPKKEYDIPIEDNGRHVGIRDYLTDDLTDAAVRFIGDHQGGPFFLYLAYNAPHLPHQAPERYLDRVPDIADTKRRTYAAMVTALDDGVGKVLETIERHGLTRRTLVFFLSDNGGPTLANASSNAPLSGHKGTLKEGGIRVPFVVSWPGRIPAGGVYDHPIISLDIFATAAAVAGAKVPADRAMDGVDVLPYLIGEKTSAPHEVLFWRQGAGYQLAIRRGDYKLLHVDDLPDKLYDLEADLTESSDLANTQEERLKALTTQLEDWHHSLPEPMFTNTGLKSNYQRRSLGLPEIPGLPR